MRPGVPWSVKGIEPEAREAAKQAARRAGMTLGAWLNQTILDTGSGEEGEQPVSFARQTAADAAARAALSSPLAAIDLGPVTDAVRDLIRRSDESERRTADMVRRLDQTIEQMAIRLDRSEQVLADGSLAADDHPAAIQTLEKAVNAVVRHLETAEDRTEKSFHEIRDMLSGMAGRLTQAEQYSPVKDIQAAVEAGLSPLSDRLDILAHRVDVAEQNQIDRDQAGSDAAAINASLADLGERLNATDRSVASLAKGLEKTQSDAIELALKAFSEKVDSEHRQTTIDEIEKNLDEMKERLDRVTTRSTDAIKAIEASLTTVAARLEEFGAPGRFVEASRLDALETKLDELTRQTGQIDARTIAANETMEHALANFSTELASTDERFDVLDSLHDTVEQMVHRVANLEANHLVPATEEAAAIGDFAEEAEAEQAAPQAAETLKESEADVAQPSSMSWLDDAPGIGAETNDPEQNEPEQDDQKAEAAASRLDDYLTVARRAAQGASYDSGSAAFSGAVFEDMPSRITAYEKEKKRHRTKIVTGVALVLLALAGALAMFRWSELTPQLDTPASIPPPLAPLGGAHSADPREGNILGPVEQRVFNRDAALSAGDQNPDGDRDAELADPSAMGEPIDKPTLELTPGELASEDAGGSDENSVSSRVALLPRPAEATPPVTAAPSTPVVAEPIEAAKPSLASAAESGNAAAQYDMGLQYARGGTVAQDYEKAAAWFKKAADQGFVSAQYRLATLYEKGRGVPEDVAIARTLYEQAATQGNVKSMHNLAVIYAEGKGTEQDFTRAAQWFGKAAEFGLGDSQYNFAILNERGLGLPQDLAEAHKWFSIAAESGDAGAAARRDTVANQLDAETLVQAKLAARTWAPRQPDPVANGDITSLRTWAEVSAAVASTPADIARAQALLTALGYDPGPADGLMGTRTHEAIRAFQVSAGLADTGEVTPDLIDKLEAVTR